MRVGLSSLPVGEREGERDGVRAGKLHRQRLKTDVSLTGFSQNEVRVKESRADRQEQEEKG